MHEKLNIADVPQADLKLAALKQQKFTSEEREKRIADSLAAINAPQPTDLPLEQWKEILAEIDDED